MTMLPLVESHPNIDAMIFYVIAAAVLVTVLYRFHHRQIE
jgi:hypothetical protein